MKSNLVKPEAKQWPYMANGCQAHGDTGQTWSSRFDHRANSVNRGPTWSCTVRTWPTHGQHMVNNGRSWSDGKTWSTNCQHVSKSGHAGQTISNNIKVDRKHVFFFSSFLKVDGIFFSGLVK